MTDLGTLTDDALADDIRTWAGRVAAGEAHLVALIGEFDRREAWVGAGLLSCAHWLTWQTGLGLTAARERVRVAARLRELPDVATAFGAGRMSWSQVRAVTRGATPDDGVDWVDLSRHSSAAQLERVVRGVRRSQAVEEATQDPELAEYRMWVRRRYDEDGTLVITIRASAEDGALLDAALSSVQADLDRRAEQHSPDDPADDSAESPPALATAADALAEMSRRILDRQREEHPATARRTRARLTAQVDPLSGWGRLADGELLPPSSLKQVLRTLPGPGGLLRLRPLTDGDLRRHDLGRTQRLPSLALRELLGAVDGERCRFPGCTRVRRLHAHHVQHWSQGGPTDLANLVLVCSRHHTLVHRDGYVLALDPDRRLSVRTADGQAVLHQLPLPWRPREELDPARRITARTLPPTDVTARMDLGYVVHVLRLQAA